MFNNNTRACQLLINAQISVNRAVFAINQQMDPFHKYHGASFSDEYIKNEIKTAIKELSEAIRIWDEKGISDQT